MSEALKQASRRLNQAKDILIGKAQDPNNLPWDPDSTSFPTRKDLPRLPGAPEDTAWVWGKDDNRGRLNLLTPTRVKAAAAEIRTGETARLDLPLNVPLHPSFERQQFKHEIMPIIDGLAYDDTYNLNTQSGTQWDGFRHVAFQSTGQFYNNTTKDDIVGSRANEKNSIHHWSVGPAAFTGRAVLLDYRSYAESQGISYATDTSHAISYTDLEACGRHQGMDIRPQSQGGDIRIGDILLIRYGWLVDYNSRSAESNKSIGERTGDDIKYAGVKQEAAMIDWLHDCYFAAVAGDSPTFECWPSLEKYYLHEYLLALWGVPIGEMLDLERVSQLAKTNKRWTFFFSSAPANCVRGVGSHVNGTAIF